MNEEDLEDRIERLVERKVQEKLDEKTNQNKQPKTENKEVTRRKFLKKIGAGAIGLGALTLTPNATAIDIKDPKGLNVHSKGTQYLDIQPGGPVKVTNAPLDVTSSRIDTRIIDFHDSSGTNHMGFFWNGTGGFLEIHDRINDYDLMRWNTGGPIEIKNTDLELPDSSEIRFNNSSDNRYDLKIRNEFDYDGWFRLNDGNGNTRFSVGRNNQAYLGGTGNGTGNKIWHQGNDGPNSGLNADTVDGQDFNDIQNWVNNNADVPNADYADTAGDADTVDGKDYSDIQDYADSASFSPAKPQNVKSNRSFNTTYTTGNSPIYLNIMVHGSEKQGTVKLTVDGTQLQRFRGDWEENSHGTLSTIVPPNTDYKLEYKPYDENFASVNVRSWTEQEL